MDNSNLTKLRLLAEGARRRQVAAESAAYEARREFEHAWLAYLDAAEASGLCRICLKPRCEGDHSGNDHILLASPA